MYSGACKVSINTIKKLNFWYGAYISSPECKYRNIAIVDFVLIYFQYGIRIIVLRKFNLTTKKMNLKTGKTTKFLFGTSENFKRVF